jgi:ABC-2 type transport system permease protein
MWRSLKLECLKLFKDFRLHCGATLLLLLLWYGFEVRHTAILKNISAMDTSCVHQKRQYEMYISLLDSVSNYGKQVNDYASDPRNPVYYSQRIPQFAHIRLMPLGILAHGQSDLYNEEVLLSARFRDPRQQKQDMLNPALLKFGQFDPTMVLVLLFPLFIIALSFNFLSVEKENGTLRLIAIQYGSIRKWIWARTLLYGLVSFLVPWLICLSLLAVYKIDLIANSKPIIVFSVFFLGYTFFWQLLAVLINAFSRSSAFNALALVCLWVVFVFILPALSNLAANELYKVPSRVSFINAVRLADVEAEKLDSSQLINQYFFDHPELVEKKDTTGKSRFSANNYWKEFVISQELINKKADPIYDTYSRKLKAANRFADNAGWISPASVFNKGLLQLAGVSSEDYYRFSDSAMQYRSNFLSDIRDRILLDREITYTNVIQRKPFTYRPAGNLRMLFIVLAFLLYTTVLFMWIQNRINNFNI